MNRALLLTVFVIFLTPIAIAQIPYFCGFEDTVENNNWQLGDVWDINQAHIGNAVAYSGNNSLYISDDGGLTNSYTPDQGEPFAFREIYFTPGFSKYQIDFDCKGGGDMQGFMRVFLGSTAVSGFLSEAPFWTHHSITVDSSFAGIQQLGFKFTYYTYLNPAGAIDNISIKGINHTTPEQLSTTDITSHSARLTWHSSSIEVPQTYLLAYRAEANTAYTETLLSATDTDFQLTNLAASNWYVWKVRTQYANNEWSEWSTEKAFKTLASIPYFCDFEDTTENKNWTIRNGANCEFDNYGGVYFAQDYYNRWFIGTPSAVTDNTLLYISGDDGISNTYNFQGYSFVWAYRDIYFEPGYAQYQLSLDFKGMGQDGQDYVKLFLDTPAIPPVDYYHSTVTFTQIGVELNRSEQWTHKSFTVDSTHSGAQRLYILWISNNNTGANPPGAIDNISINVPTCGVPDNLTSNPQDTTAMLSWSPGNIGNTSSYILVYKTLSDSTYTELTTQDTFLAIQGLIPNTDYIWRVRAICSAPDTGEWSSDALFTTTQRLAHLPYLCSFNNPNENNLWTLANGFNENQWVIGNATGYGDNNALYISNDSGTTNAYSIASTSSVWAYRDIYFDENQLAYQLSFDYKGIGQNSADYLKVFAGPPSVPSGTATPAGAIQLGGPLFGENNWVHYSYVLDSTHVGIQRIYFLWVNNNSNGTQPPAAVDNLSVSDLPCITPSDLTITAITAYEATLSWSAGSVIQPPSYTISVRSAGDTITTEYSTTDTFYVLSNLTPSAFYYCKVRANCSSSGQSGWSSDVFVRMPADLPFICDFEDSGERNAWQTVNGNYTNKWYIGEAVDNGGDYSLYISNNGGVSNAYSNYSSYVWAYRDIYFDPSDSVYSLSFDIRVAGGIYSDIAACIGVYIGSPVTPNGSTIPSGLTMLDDGLSGMPAWTTKTYTLDHSYAGLRRLFFYWVNTSYSISNPPAAIDNINIVGTPCTRVPSGLSAQVMDTLANLSWTLSNGSVDSYTVAYKRQYDNVYTYITVYDEHTTIGNLTPMTTYIWKVRSDCNVDDHSFWSAETTFQTPINTARIPYICDFEDVNENNQWRFINGNFTDNWHIGGAVNNGGTHSLYVSNDNGATNAYTLNRRSLIWAYRDIYLDPRYSDYEISFDCRAFGELYNNHPVDYAKVFLGPPTTPGTTSSVSIIVVPNGATQIGDVIYLDSTWHNINFSLGPNFSGLQRLYILWRDDGLSGTNPPAAFDNISILPADCGKPYQVAVSSVADVSANLSWSNVYQAASYKIAYREISDTVYTELTCTTPHHYLTGLTPMTTYILKVKALCDSATEGVWSDEVMFTTTQVYATIPYYGSFEDANDNAHWTLQNGTSTNKWYIGAAVHTDGDSALYISNDGGVSNVYTPASGSRSWAYRDILLTPGYSNYHISFKVHSWFPNNGTPNNSMRAFFGAPSEPSGENQPEGTISLGGYYHRNYDWTEYNFDLDTSFAGIQRLYFIWSDHIGSYNLDCSRPAAIDELFIGGSECTTPSDLNANVISSSEVILSWSSDQGLLDSYGYYMIAYRTTTDSTWTETTVQDTTLVLTGLTSSTNYVWRVKSFCSINHEGYWSNESFFSTEAEVATLPYFCGFEDANENREWRLLNADVNQWHIGQAAHQTGDYGLYVSEDNGATNSYDVYGSMSNSWAYRDIYFTPGYSEYQIAFDFRGLGNPGNDITRVFLGTPVAVQANTTYTITIPSELEELGTGLDSDTNWTIHSFTVDSTHAGHQRLYFLWSNDYYTGTNPPGAIDNIVIYGGTCAAPYALTVDSISRNSISISFTPANADDQSWEAVIMEAGQPIDTTQIVTLTSTSNTFCNLVDDTPYSIYVRTNCGDGYSSWCSANQRTDCGLVTSLPYEETFDTYGTGGNMNGNSAFPRCWSRLSTSYINYPRPFIYAIGSYSAPGLLYFQPSNGYEISILPEFDNSIPLNTLQVSFKFKAITSAANSTLMVGVMTNPDDYSTFLPVETVYPNSFAPTSWIDKVVSLASYTGSGHYIAFAQEHYGNPLSAVGLDNVVVDYIPSCPSPINVVATAVNYSSVSVDWQPSGTETAWRVVVVPSGTAPSTSTPVLTTSHPITIGNLIDNTIYDVYVQADCGNGDESPWSVATQVKTPCAPVSNLPYTEDFDDYAWMSTSVVRPDCWIFPVTYADYPRIDWNTYGYYGMESKALLFKSDTSVSATAVTPSFDVDVHSLRMQFKLSADHENIAGCMEVGVMSDPNDLSTFESVQVFSIAQSDIWQEVTVDFRHTAMTGTGKYIAFRQVGTHSPNMAMWIDNIVIYQASDCDAPTALSAYDLSPTSATINFEPSASTSSQWEYVVCDVNASPDSQTPTSVSDTFFNLSNLISGESYDIYVRTICGTINYSDWSEPLTITTDCRVIDQLPYTETFDNYGTDSETAFPDCWRRPFTSASYSYYPIISSETSYSGIGSLMFFSNSFSDGWAIAPALAPEINLDSIQLEFKYYQDTNAVPGWDTMLVGVMSSPYDETSFMPVDTITLQTWGVWESHSVIFDIYPGIGRYVAFRYHCPAYLGRVFIDDVVFSKRPVGVTEYELGSYLHIYPNPTTGKCTIRNEQYVMERIEVYDVFGKQLNTLQINDYQIDIDLSSYASSVYFLRVFTKQGIVTKRVVKR
ncbi:MAG: fibronectin type III domain-containing protein [Bacteroidales bacterium]|nr:fibronectin type III domain-containing protein [Bacteroidales bacterium]